jgi:Leucine-rich repeat (LRR) protein
VALPRMFERYKDDFGTTDLEVLEYISEFITGERQQQFKFLLQGRSSLIRIRYHDDPNVFNVEDNILEGENVDQDEVAKVMARRIQKHQSEAEGSNSLSLDRLHSERLSKELFGLVHLTELDLSRNKLDQLPAEFVQLSQLRFLNLNSNRLRTLENFPALNLEVLELADNLLQAIPTVFCQSMTTLRSLSLESNQLQKLPKEFSSFQKLEELYLQSNQFTRIPSTLGNI